MTDRNVNQDGRGRRVVLAGASGLVGGHLLQGLLLDPGVAEIHLPVRREFAHQEGKVRVHLVDFRCFPELPAVDEVYLALGTTMRVAGSREAFRAVDVEANLAVAKAAFAAGARRMGVVSAVGADSGSRFFYSRVKGELEEALRWFEAEATVIARPSLLLGDRESLNQPYRVGEAIATVLMRRLGFLLPRDQRPVEAERVARALLAEVPRARGWRVLSSGLLQGY